MGTNAFYCNKSDIYNTYDGNDLGYTYTPDGTTFKVWAPSAEQVLLKLYSTGSFYERGAQVLSIKQMLFDAATGVWSAYIDGDLNHTYYTYVIKTEKGTCETQDVYSKAVGVNSARSEVVDLSETDPAGWENDHHVVPEKPTDAIIWEVHIRDFSSSDTSGVSKEHRGKFLAFTEKNTCIPFTDYPTCVNYLKKLGITHLTAHNIAAVYLGKKLGFTVHAGFGMNIANSYTLSWAKEYGIADAVLSVELDEKRINALRKCIPVGIIRYGHLPLMLCRNHPAGAEPCKKIEFLQDRKDERFPVIRRVGYSEIMNCVPLLMPQKDYDFNNKVFSVFLFSVENSVDNMEKTMRKLSQNLDFERKTHGLYIRGVKNLTIF